MSPKKENHASPVDALNHLVALYTITAQNARLCHWNVIGPMFEDHHEIFGELYDMLADEIDVFAEQVRILGEYPMSRLSDYLSETKLKEYAPPLTWAEMIKAMHEDLLYISTKMEEFIELTDDDACTQDVIIAAKKDLDKKRWFFRAMLSKK
jgi:starvation-inducible DNA-binding protein